jgi:hypothetical protein
VPRLTLLESIFPKLVAAGYEKTSDETGPPNNPGSYNCIAWAAGDTHHGFWWPMPDGYWPGGIKRESTISCFINTFRSLGYRICEHSGREILYDKVVLYAIHKSYAPMPSIPKSLDGFKDWKPTHMARQLSDGTWTSKCGWQEDITHFTLDAFESYWSPNAYGCAVLYMRRLVVVTVMVRIGQFLQRIYEAVFG